jgi:hypothetical protein
VRGGIGNAKALASYNHQALKRPQGHRRPCQLHARGQLRRIARTAPRIGEKKQRVTMKLPVAAQILQHLGSHRHHAVLTAFAIPHHDLALVAEDVMNRE